MPAKAEKKKEFIDYALIIAEKGFIGLVVLGLIPFSAFFLGLTFLFLLYGNQFEWVEVGGLVISIGIIFYYGMVAGIWTHKQFVVSGKLDNFLERLGLFSDED